MSSVDEEDAQLRQSVYSALESRGVLNTVRAKLRSEVFQAIQDSDGGNSRNPNQFDKTAANMNALALVYDFLYTYNFPNAASVLAAECGIGFNDPSVNLESVSKSLGYNVQVGAGSCLQTVIAGATVPADSPTKSPKGGLSSPPPGPPPSGLSPPPSSMPPPPPEDGKGSPGSSPAKPTGPPKVNRNVRLDISDDSVEDVIPHKASSPTKLESLGESGPQLGKIPTIDTLKPKLASLAPLPSTSDPFSKPKLPSPMPSPSESLESSLELTSNSLSMSFSGKEPVEPLKSPDREGNSSKDDKPAAESPNQTIKTEESYEDDYEDDYESGGSFDDMDEEEA